MIAAAIIPIVGSGADPAKAVALASALALLIGVTMTVAGAAKLGFVADLLSKPTQIGYMNGLALTILIGQLPKLFGFSVDGDRDRYTRPAADPGPPALAAEGARRPHHHRRVHPGRLGVRPRRPGRETRGRPAAGIPAPHGPHLPTPPPPPTCSRISTRTQRPRDLAGVRGDEDSGTHEDRTVRADPDHRPGTLLPDPRRRGARLPGADWVGGR